MIDGKLAGLFGIAPEDRARTVTNMLDSRRRGAAGYWLQLVLAMAIATLGLVLGSTAVVIGAMLVSPLMTPIIELGMGLAIGSPLLVVRAAARSLGSVAVVVVSAALIVVALPIHELTDEISARTSPTVLDLAIASCCAMAGVYATIRPGSDTASTAAGTAIGIALVPPLCVVGYGVGTASPRVAGGSALLFTANLCAILLFSVLAFLLLGYGRVDVADLERTYAESDAPSGFMTRLARRLSVFFSSRLGPLVRFAMPALLVAIVFLPLRSALAHVTWEVRVRSAAQAALRSLPGPHVQSSLRIEGDNVTLSVVAIGTQGDAANLRRALAAPIARAAGSEPTVLVTMVPDASALDRASTSVHAAPALPPAQEPPLEGVRRALDGTLAAWPVDEAGPLLTHRLDLGSRDEAILEVVHLGKPLAPSAESFLARSVGLALDARVRIRDVALPSEPIVAGKEEGDDWLVRATESLTVIGALPSSARISACIAVAGDPETSPLARAVQTSPAFHDPRVSIMRGETWSLHFSTAGCAAATDGGASDAGASDGG